jgi:hypothetical protein
MTADQRAYLRRETLVAVAINAALSTLFCFLVFGGGAAIPTRDLVRDAAPQSFMIALMTTIVPTLLTRRRLRTGRLAPLPGGSILPSSLSARAVLVAVAAPVLGTAVNALVLPAAGIAAWTFGAVLALKIAYGALLAAACAPFLLRRALADATALGR